MKTNDSQGRRPASVVETLILVSLSLIPVVALVKVYVVPSNAEPAPRPSILSVASASSSSLIGATDGVDLGVPIPKGVWDGRGGVKVLEHDVSTRRLVLQINFGDNRRLRVGVLHDQDPKGWTIHVGDSETNNGYGGDGGSQSNDAEAQVVGGSLMVYGSDTAPQNEKVLSQGKNIVKAHSWTVLEVADRELAWLDPVLQSMSGIKSPHLFALGGQVDTEGTPNRTVYLGVNRTIAQSHDRVGAGAARVLVEFVK